MSNSDDARPQIALGIGAGAATFKAIALASILRKQGYLVRTYMTEAAQGFVTPLAFQAVTFAPVITSTLSMEETGPSHLEVADAKALIVLPATADLMAKLAHGFASDPVCLAATAMTGLKMFAPAMNEKMWSNAAVQRNVAALEADAWLRIGPVFGTLAEGYEGDGRMEEPEAIAERLLSELSARGDA